MRTATIIGTVICLAHNPAAGQETAEVAARAPAMTERVLRLRAATPGPVVQNKGAIAGSPVGTDDSYKALADRPLSVAAPGFLGNDIDRDGEALSAVSLVDDVDHGTLAAFPDGRFDYTPNAGFIGIDGFAYRMRDASNNFVGPVSVSIEVIEGNRAPRGTNDVYAVRLNTLRSVAAPGFLGNDIDPDGEALIAISLVDDVDHGTLAAFPDGRFNYTPNAGFTGFDGFAYRMRDASGKNSDPIPVTLNVVAAGSLPVGVADGYKALADRTLSVAAPGFLGNDIDRDGEALSAVSLVDDVDHGTLAAFPDGRFDYTPNAGFIGLDGFAYRMRDASNNFVGPVPVSIRVIEGNRAPRGTDDAYAVRLNTLRSVAAPGFLGNDIDPDGEALSATSLVDDVDHGTLVAFADGRFDYTPNAGFTGTDGFAYEMRDASGRLSGPVVVILEVYHPAPLVFANGFE